MLKCVQGCCSGEWCVGVETRAWTPATVTCHLSTPWYHSLSINMITQQTSSPLTIVSRGTLINDGSEIFQTDKNLLHQRINLKMYNDHFESFLIDTSIVQLQLLISDIKTQCTVLFIQMRPSVQFVNPSVVTIQVQVQSPKSKVERTWRLYSDVQFSSNLNNQEK